MTPLPNFFEAILLSYMLLGPAIDTLKQIGIIWRDTFHPLDASRCGVV
jgi:hypothetical protein